MPHSFRTRDRDFTARFDAFLHIREEKAADVAEVVRGIIARVKSEGDAALLALTERFDRVKLDSKTMKVSRAEMATARKACGKKIVSALEAAAKRIRLYHEKQKPKDARWKDKQGVTLGWKWSALESVGLYVPGGTANYPSAVLMSAVPAKVAGVSRLVMTVPTPDGVINPAVLAAADIAGISDIYRVGGAQAVAALAFGTKSIAAVDKILGPGNVYVTEAKRQVFGTVGIDIIAGPSEICVVADGKNEPRWIAADLLSQAEHDASSQSVLITDDAAFAAKVEEAVEQLLVTLPRRDIASESWKDYGAIILVRDLKEAPAIVNRLAPEHVELAVAKPEPLAKAIHRAGAIFLGRHTPEAVGDYVAGPSHVLPTSRAARFSSGLGVLDFMTRSSLIACTQKSLRAIGPDAVTLAETEGLDAHALSLSLRL